MSQWLEKCPVREGNLLVSFFILSSLFCSMLKFTWKKLKANSLLFLTSFFWSERRALLTCPLHSGCLCIQVPFILFSFNCQMKMQLQLEVAFFFFSHVHNYYPVRERSCICVKINFLSYFKLPSFAAMTGLHNEPFTFQYPEGGSSINIFNCHFVFHRGEILSMKNVQNVLLHSILSLILIFTVPSLMGHYHSPGVHTFSVYAANICITI